MGRETNKSYESQFEQWLGWLLPVSLVVIIQIVSSIPSFVESCYYEKLYPYISLFQRYIFGRFQFSMGDIGYAIFIIYLIVWFVKFSILIYKKEYSFLLLKRQLLSTVKGFLWVYIGFNILWGLNYSRLGIANQLKLKDTTYTNQELKDLLCDVVDELNTTRIALGDSDYIYPATIKIFDTAFNAYKDVKIKMPFLTYNNQSVKSSILSGMVSYAGYSGYYNPFSGEAQVNTDLPKFYIPYVTCHEMAHQIGYASESEASFVGYLAAINSRNTLFRYSALFELFTVANAELFNTDFISAILNIKSLNSLVKRDRRIYRDYILSKQNYVEPVMKTVYDQYLKANKQKSGINSYNELVGWVIHYRRKYGAQSVLGLK